MTQFLHIEVISVMAFYIHVLIFNMILTLFNLIPKALLRTFILGTKNA